VVVIAGAAESLVDNGDFPTTWDGIWWAVVTVTTVGYGDRTPTSVQGRIVAMVVMLFGVGFLSVLTATVASRFVKTERDDETEAILEALVQTRPVNDGPVKRKRFLRTLHIVPTTLPVEKAHTR
jgi:voltage-gated potassium channel